MLKQPGAAGIELRFSPGTAVIHGSGLKHQRAESGLLKPDMPTFSVRKQMDRRQAREDQDPMRQFWSIW